MQYDRLSQQQLSFLLKCGESRAVERRPRDAAIISVECIRYDRGVGQGRGSEEDDHPSPVEVLGQKYISPTYGQQRQKAPKMNKFACKIAKFFRRPNSPGPPHWGGRTFSRHLPLGAMAHCQGLLPLHRLPPLPTPPSAKNCIDATSVRYDPVCYR